MQSRFTLSLIAASTMLAGCVAGPAPDNFRSAQWAPGQVDRTNIHPNGDWMDQPARQAKTTATCTMLSGQVPRGQQVTLRDLGPADHLLAPGDRLHINILGDPDGLSGTYTIDPDGTVALGTVAPVQASGMQPADFERVLRAELVFNGLVRPLRNSVRIRLAEAAGVTVHVAGAVFQSGVVHPGERTPESRVGQKEGELAGDTNPSRTVSAAIRAAGGVRPDANVTNIFIVRGDRYAAIDLFGLVAGFGATDPVITSGDRIIVPATDCFDDDLVRPSALTQPGIKVYMSNLTRSANNNACAAIGEKTGSLPYGTRMLQGLVAMNCVGGTYMQSDRRAVLISRNPRNGKSIVIERDIEKLVREADRDEADPYLMPGDALACYDSRWTNFREALGLIGEATGTATAPLLITQAIN